MGNIQEIDVLMIEDNSGDARLIQELLSEIQEPVFHLRWAKRLSEGLEFISNTPFEIILLDLSLPDSSGFETVAEVRRKAPTLPVIVLTGLNNEEVGLKAIQEGAQDYLVKGTVDGSMLSRIIRYAIERKKNEDALRESQEMLKRKNLEILEFTNMVTHDLRKPLTVMEIIMELMNNGAFGALSGDGAEAVGTGLEAAKYMQEMLEDLIACARLDAGIQELAIEETGFMELVGTVIARLKYHLDQKKILVETTDEEAAVPADKKQLTRVFMNLIGNAVNYIGNGPDKRIRIGWERRNGVPVFFVKDNGIGIPEESQKRLFKKFTRGSNVSGTTGTGLGLFIVKGIIEAHGGKIWFDSEVGKGTAFYFTLGCGDGGSREPEDGREEQNQLARPA